MCVFSSYIMPTVIYAIMTLGIILSYTEAAPTDNTTDDSDPANDISDVAALTGLISDEQVQQCTAIDDWAAGFSAAGSQVQLESLMGNAYYFNDELATAFNDLLSKIRSQEMTRGEAMTQMQQRIQASMDYVLQNCGRKESSIEMALSMAAIRGYLAEIKDEQCDEAARQIATIEAGTGVVSTMLANESLLGDTAVDFKAAMAAKETLSLGELVEKLEKIENAFINDFLAGRCAIALSKQQRQIADKVIEDWLTNERCERISSLLADMVDDNTQTNFYDLINNEDLMDEVTMFYGEMADDASKATTQDEVRRLVGDFRAIVERHVAAECDRELSAEQREFFDNEFQALAEQLIAYYGIEEEG